MSVCTCVSRLVHPHVHILAQHAFIYLKVKMLDIKEGLKSTYIDFSHKQIHIFMRMSLLDNKQCHVCLTSIFHCKLVWVEDKVVLKLV